MKKYYNNKTIINISDEIEKNKDKYNEYFIYNYNEYKDNNEHYFPDLNKHIKLNNLLDKQYLCIFGDVHNILDKPAITKSCPININNDNNIIFKLSIDRHFGMLKKNNFNIIPWEDKINKAVWRGVDTGNNDRFKLISKDYKIHNVGFTDFVQNYKNKKKEYNYLLKEKLTYNDQLKYKYLISIEGNDVATGLKWMLYSNSIVLMKKPTKETWIMENKLIPFQHYILLNDNLDNLDEMIKWCMLNDNECKKISNNATKYIELFLDENNENKIINEILNRINNNIIYTKN